MRRSKNRQSNSMIVTHSQPKHLTICVKQPPIISSIITKHGVTYLKNNFKQIVARQHKLSNAIGNRILIIGIIYAQIKLNTSRSMYSILVMMPSKKYAKSISNWFVVYGLVSLSVIGHGRYSAYLLLIECDGKIINNRKYCWSIDIRIIGRPWCE